MRKMEGCKLRRCQGKRGCLCPKKPKPAAAEVQEWVTVEHESKAAGARKIRKPNNPSRSSRATRSNAATTAVKAKAPGTKAKINPANGSGMKSPALEKESVSMKTKSKEGIDPSLSEGKENPPPTGNSKGADETANTNQSDPAKAEAGDDTGDAGDGGKAGGDGEVTIRYNHYDRKFKIEGGKLPASAIDDEYALTFAYPKAKLHLSATQQSIYDSDDDGEARAEWLREEGEGVFVGLAAGSTYWVVIEEDKEEREKYEKAPKRVYTVEDAQESMMANKDGLRRGNRNVDDITNQLKGMSTKELREKGAEYKALIEARDLEDCLFSGV